MTVDFYAFVQAAEDRRRELGLAETPADAEAMRNKGARRSAGKRALLNRMERRAKAAGKTAARAFY